MDFEHWQVTAAGLVELLTGAVAGLDASGPPIPCAEVVVCAASLWCLWWLLRLPEHSSLALAAGMREHVRRGTELAAVVEQLLIQDGR